MAEACCCAGALAVGGGAHRRPATGRRSAAAPPRAAARALRPAWRRSRTGAGGTGWLASPPSDNRCQAPQISSTATTPAMMPPALRQAARSSSSMRRGLARLIVGAAGNLALEALDILRGIQAQMPRIGAHKADRIGLARQSPRAGLLPALRDGPCGSSAPARPGRSRRRAAAARRAGPGPRFPAALSLSPEISRKWMRRRVRPPVTTAVIRHGTSGNLGHKSHESRPPQYPKSGPGAAKYLCAPILSEQDRAGTTAALQKVRSRSRISAEKPYFRTIPRSAAKAESRVRRRMVGPAAQPVHEGGHLAQMQCCGSSS